MKRLMGLLITITIIFTVILSTDTLAAEETLGNLKKQQSSLENQLATSEEQQKLTEAQRKETENKIASTKVEIQKTNDEISELAKEIVKLNEDIEAKDKEIKNIINFIQIANGESAYMEYIFGAKDFTDFIYRVAVSEQMVDYNDELIEEFNALIEKNNEKTAELKSKQVKLGEQQKELEIEMSKLGEKLSDLKEGEQDMRSQLKSKKEAIQSLEKMGCKDSETHTSCLSRIYSEQASQAGSGYIPNGSGFVRPLNYGTVSSEYSWRNCPVHGYELHTGIDLAASGWSVPVYSAAPGTVASITRRASCGGNQIYIHHIINGKSYTTGYMHLRNINVSVGQYVTPNTVIATMGGDPSNEWWDGCSTGQHLHFMVANGLYYLDYWTYSAFTSHLMNPRSVLGFPGTGGYFSGRL